MKKITLILMTFVSIFVYGQQDFTVKLNDSVFDISLEKEYNIPVNGKNIKFTVFPKDTLTYDDEVFSFKYPKDYKISKTVIDEGIEQYVIMSAEGSGIIIQKYLTINPTSLNAIMLSEVTKESLNYGYVMKREDYKRKLLSGQTLDVDKAILTYKEDKNVYEIASIGKKDEGIVIVTMIMDYTQKEQGEKIIDLMWNSLIYK